MDFMAITTIAVLALSGSLVLAGGFGLCVEFSRLTGGRAPPSWVAPITVRLPALIVSAAAGGLRLAAMLTRGDVLPMLSVILPFVLGVIVLPPLFACLGEEEKGSHGCCRVGILPRDVTFC